MASRELAHYSGTTEEMYSKIFSHTATLAGAPGNAGHLAEVGRHVGRVAYLLDGYVDFQKDKSEGRFNVFDHLSSSGGSSRIRSNFSQLAWAKACCVYGRTSSR